MLRALVSLLVLAVLCRADVCSVSCDNRDPSTAQQDAVPVPRVFQHGRRIALHVSEPDAMAWASIDNGARRDEVWVERSWDGGATWEGPLGQVAIPSRRSGARTLMFNIADPAHHRRGLVRACGSTGCTEWFPRKVCDRACDGERKNHGDAQPVGPTTLAGRTIVLHVDDRGMFWGTIANGTAGDEVWLDRSWSEGKDWDGGSSLGRTLTPARATGTRTALFAARDPKLRLYGGAVRACGRAVTGNSGSCTAWARAGGDRAAAAADALMWAYQPDTAWWLSSWWNSAVATTVLIDWMYATGRRDYLWAMDRTLEVNKQPFPAGVKSTDELEGHFISRAIDDAAWWGIAWARAFDLTGDTKYRDEAVIIAEYVHQFWDTSTCGGGVWWDRERTYKNAVTIGLYIRLTAVLHSRLPGDTTWRDRAVTAWTWYEQSGMINSDWLVNDGLRKDCTNNGDTVRTYNQGLAIGGALEVYRITGNASALAAARRLADATMAGPPLTVGGVLSDACDAADRTCSDNGKQYKGIFMRYFGDLASETRDDKYIAYVRQQADNVWTTGRDNLNRVGQRWNGVENAQFPNARDWRTQASGMGALVAAIGL